MTAKGVENMNDKDEEWIQKQLQRMIERTPESVRETFDAEHEATDKVTFEQFWKGRYRAERVSWRKAEDAKALAEQARQDAIAKAVEKEVLELFGVNYLIYVGGKRLDKPKHIKDAIKCPSCGSVAEGMAEGSLRACYDARQGAVQRGDEAGELPFKLKDQYVCPHCRAALGSVVYLALQ